MFESNLKDISKADEGIKDLRVADIARKAAKSAITIVRDEDKIIPVDKNKKILLIEQINPLHERTNTQRCHPSLLWMKMLNHSENVGVVETLIAYTEDDMERVKERLHEIDIIVITNYFDRRQSCTGDNFVKEICRLGLPVIVITNSPYSFTVCDEYNTVIVTYGSSPETMEEIANIIYGENSEPDSTECATVMVAGSSLTIPFELVENRAEE
jgi:beta-N-acetylhexosaminidase